MTKKGGDNCCRGSECKKLWVGEGGLGVGKGGLGISVLTCLINFGKIRMPSTHEERR